MTSKPKSANTSAISFTFPLCIARGKYNFLLRDAVPHIKHCLILASYQKFSE